MAQQRYEGVGFFERLKELKILFIFIFGSAIISILIMNIIVFPLSLFAVKFSPLYTFIVKCSFLFAAAGYIVFRIVRRIRITREEGTATKNAVLSSASRKGKSLVSFLLISLFTLALIVGLYYLLRYNYIILYEMTQ